MEWRPSDLCELLTHSEPGSSFGSSTVCVRVYLMCLQNIRKILFSHNEKIKTCKKCLICNPNYTYTRIQNISMSFSETTAKRTTREKNTICTYFSLQWVASWRVPENTKANHQQTEETLPFLYLIHHSRVSRSIFATKQGLMTPFISNQLHKLHCDKSKTKNRRYLSRV